MKKIVIATRGSRLALWQANYIKSILEARHTGLQVELMVVKTKGDKILDTPLAKVGGKGLFVKEIEEMLLLNKADIAVHSMKDVPMELPPELFLGAILEREDPTDMFISMHYKSLDDLPPNACVGTSSLRRQAQLLFHRKDLHIVALRGNIDTRLKRLIDQDFDAIIMATSGIKRLELLASHMVSLPTNKFLPAVGQGALCIEFKKDRDDLIALTRCMEHEQTRVCIEAERSFLAGLNGGCQVPIAGYATIQTSGILKLEGLVADVDGSQRIFDIIEGSVASAQELGAELSNKLISSGAQAILSKLYT